MCFINWLWYRIAISIDTLKRLMWSCVNYISIKRFWKCIKAQELYEYSNISLKIFVEIILLFKTSCVGICVLVTIRTKDKNILDANWKTCEVLNPLDWTHAEGWVGFQPLGRRTLGWWCSLPRPSRPARYPTGFLWRDDLQNHDSYVSLCVSVPCQRRWHDLSIHLRLKTAQRSDC